MGKIKKGCNGILIIAVFITLYIPDIVEADFSLEAPSTKKEILRIPLAINNRIGKKLDLSHYLFESEFEMVRAGYMPGEIAGILTDNIKSLMPIKENEILYRGLRLSISALERVVLAGMLVSETFTNKISVTFCPNTAVDYAFWPDTRSKNYPKEDFLCAVFKLGFPKITYFLESREEENCMFTNEDVLPRYILSIYIFDTKKKQFVNVTKTMEEIFTKGATDIHNKPLHNL